MGLELYLMNHHRSDQMLAHPLVAQQAAQQTLRLDEAAVRAFSRTTAFPSFAELQEAFIAETGKTGPLAKVDFGLGLGTLVLDGRVEVLESPTRTAYRLRGGKELVQVCLYVMNRVPGEDDRVSHATTVLSTVDQVQQTRKLLAEAYEADPFLSEQGPGAYPLPKYIVEVETTPGALV